MAASNSQPGVFHCDAVIVPQSAEA